METVSELFARISEKPSVYNIVHLENIPSIMDRGILCFEQAQRLRHCSIAMNSVQARRATKSVPNGLRLHEYANAYFTPRNPMLYCRRNIADRLCILAISAQILDMDGVVVSDGNAASDATRFFTPREGLNKLDFDAIYAYWWYLSSDPWLVQEEKKRKKCAEVLVPRCIAYHQIIGAIVVCEETKCELQRLGFEKKVAVRPKTFFESGCEI